MIFSLNSRDTISTLISIFSLFVVVIVILGVIFPALIISNLGIHSNTLDSFEIGNNALIVSSGIISILVIGFIYYKKKFPSEIQNILSTIFKKNISKKTATIIIISILIPYVILTTPELFIDENNIPDYEIFLAAKEIFPFGTSQFTEAVEQNDRYVRMILLITSLEIFQNVKIIPFLGSIALLVVTYLFTTEITKNRLSGIISFLFLIQSYTFLKYDSYAMYENFWVLFYVLSLYLIYKKFFTSSISYALSIFTKAFTALFVPMSLVLIFYSNLKIKTKALLLLTYVIMFVFVISIWSLDASVYDNILRFDLNHILTALGKIAYQIRFDTLFLASLLPLTIGLIIKARNGFNLAIPILFLITGSVFAGAVVEMLSDHFVILPYRFVPTIVFFAVGIGILFNHRIEEKEDET